MPSFDLQFWDGLLKIVVVNILLSGDNAVVIALACRSLPDKYRNTAVLAGSAGAVGIRVLFCVIIAWLMAIPAIKLIGGVLLLWIGVKLIADEDGEGEGEDGNAKAAASDRLWGAVRTVVVADLVMSIDNVLGVAAAAKGSVVLLVFGLVVSIPLVIAGSQVILKLIERFPVLILAGGGLLGWVAGEMMVEDAAIAPWIGAHAHWLEWLVPVAGVLVVIGVARALRRPASISATRPWGFRGNGSAIRAKLRGVASISTWRLPRRAGTYSESDSASAVTSTPLAASTVASAAGPH